MNEETLNEKQKNINNERSFGEFYRNRMNLKNRFDNSFINMHEKRRVNPYLYKRELKRIRLRIKSDII